MHESSKKRTIPLIYNIFEIRKALYRGNLEVVAIFYLFEAHSASMVTEYKQGLIITLRASLLRVVCYFCIYNQPLLSGTFTKCGFSARHTLLEFDALKTKSMSEYFFYYPNQIFSSCILTGI